VCVCVCVGLFRLVREWQSVNPYRVWPALPCTLTNRCKRHSLIIHLNACRACLRLLGDLTILFAQGNQAITKGNLSVPNTRSDVIRAISQWHGLKSAE
jgi:hypothetical protein